IAAQFGRPMRADRAYDGYRVSGRAPFVSNCQDANWIATTALVMEESQPQTDEAGQPIVVMAYLPAMSCQVVDTWHVLGMRGTGSHDVEVTDVFVPGARTFALAPDFTLGSHYQGPLYRFPLVGTVATNLPPLLLAVARQAIDEVVTLAQSKMPVVSSTSLRERGSTQAAVAQAEASLRAGRLLLYDTLNEVWEATLAGKTISLEQKADLQLAMAHSVSSA